MNPALVLIMVFFLGIATGLMVAVPYSSIEYRAAIIITTFISIILFVVICLGL